MTYKELVDRIEDAVVRHKMLTDFGYGQLSDIKVLDNSEDGADYPYAFLLPGPVARTGQAVTYNFSLIVMEMAITPREILQVQSDCIQYINDLVADLRFDTGFAGDINLSQSVQVFRERFQDEVAGATLNLQVTVADPINKCDAPLDPRLFLGVTRRADEEMAFDFDGFPDGDDDYLEFRQYSYNGTSWITNTGRDPEYGSRYRSIIPYTTGLHRLEFDMDFRFVSEAIQNGRIKYGIRVSGPSVDETLYFDEPWTDADTWVNVQKTFDLELAENQEYYFRIVPNYGGFVPSVEVAGYMKLHSTYKVYTPNE